MKVITKATLVATTIVTLFFAACDPERNKASVGDSADTLATDNAKHKYEDGTLQRTPDTTKAKKDSTVSNTEHANPTGHMEKQ